MRAGTVMSGRQTLFRSRIPRVGSVAKNTLELNWKAELFSAGMACGRSDQADLSIETVTGPSDASQFFRSISFGGKWDGLPPVEEHSLPQSH